MKEKKKWFKIGELERLTGISRRTVHYYLQIGLLHPPEKTGKTMAYYDELHIKKLETIGELKQQGLPLFAIREKISGVPKEKTNRVKLTESIQLKKHDEKKQKLPQRIQGKKTREGIIKLAIKIFKEKGYKETKVNDITSQLNIGKGSFYFFFKNKKELFLECAPGIFEALFSEGWDKIYKEKNPLKRMDLRMDTVLPARREFSSIIKLCKEVLNDDDPKLRSLGNQIIISIRKPFESDINKCIEQGLIPAVNPKIISLVTIIIIENIDFFLSVEKDFSRSTIQGIINGIWKGLLHNE
ncbi:MAG: MerR family transcriptional regulator [Desulfobacterales bacterium]|nr:MerR family transcriptional regulator [Desulfobacteraceae bacterium]MBT4363296.1 MerR family transcriptional regulator [Desulfobacteraceae bacterium]MBT7085118.1 MerR family transcriptional regulator [Desulfobacterales bacterium]